MYTVLLPPGVNPIAVNKYIKLMLWIVRGIGGTEGIKRAFFAAQGLIDPENCSHAVATI
jgi:hypothetical protein